MLLKRSYQRVEPNAEFRQTLLDKLKHQQHQRLRRKTRARMLYLFSSVGAAAAVVALTLMPSLTPQTSQSSQSSQPLHTVQAPVVASQDQTGSSLAPETAANANPLTPTSVMAIPETQQTRPDAFLASSGSSTSGSHITISDPDATPVRIASTPVAMPSAELVKTAAVSSEDILDLGTVKTIQTFDAVEVRNPGQSEWTQLARGAEFSPVEGTEIRTLGESSTALRMAEGSFIVLDQHGMIRRTADGYALENGCAMVSLGTSRLNMQLRDKSLHIPQSSRIFAQVQGGQAYAPGGEPAPVVIVMDGAVSLPSAPQRPLLAGYAYRLYDTPTGILPHHQMGGLDRERFNRLSDVMLAGYEQ